MTRRDLAWRMGGGLVAIGACAASALDPYGPRFTPLYFLIAILGTILVFNGKRVLTVWQAERRGHVNTAAVIHAARLRRRKAQDGRSRS